MANEEKLDQIDGIQHSVSEIEEYLRKAVVWGRIIIIGFLSLSLVVIIIYNFFSPPEKDVSQEVIDRLLKTIAGAGAQHVQSTQTLPFTSDGKT